MQLSETAARKVREIATQQGHPEAALRIAAEPGGCCGYRYSMALVGGVEPGDVAEEHHGVRVVTDPNSAPILAQAEIDFVDTLQQTGFAIHNPTASRGHGHGHGHAGNGGGCGCGRHGGGHGHGEAEGETQKAGHGAGGCACGH